jgi:Asp-tRNA(Asn)/Glu-tRNA(Gln) amidotransferase A subunit family amidase
MVGKTHLNEFAYGLDGMNAHYGNGTHPWDTGRISGGSSSGSAWAVGRGVTPLAFGTDTGGSVRVPAALCGVYGVRLEPNDLVHDGVFPLSQTFDTAGWFTAVPEDAATFWEALSSVDGEVRLSPEEWSGRILYAPREDVLDEPALERLYRDALPLLASHQAASGGRDGAHQGDRAGAKATGGPSDPASAELERYLRESGHDHVTAYNVIGSSDAYSVHAPYLEEYADRYEERVRLLIERGAHWPRGERERAREIQRSTEEHLRGLLSKYDAIVLPTTHVVAPPFAEAGFDFRRRILALTAPASLARVPVVTVPVFREDGLSGGLQVLIHPERPGLGVSLLRHLAAHHP